MPQLAAGDECLRSKRTRKKLSIGLDPRDRAVDNFVSKKNHYCD